MEYTLGPWYTKTTGDDKYQSEIVQESTGKTVALTYTSCDADAHLIAAAPELLEVCKSLIDMITDHRLHGPEIDQACYAIAKAEGRQ